MESTDGRQNVFLVEDDPSARDALVAVLESHDLRVEAFVSGESFLETFDDEHIGCLVTDLRLHGMSGLQLQRELAGRNRGLPVIVLTGYSTVGAAVEAMKQGAIEFFEKPVAIPRLIRTIGVAFAVDRKRQRWEFRRRNVLARITRLSRREREVMRLIATGHANKVVASELGIREKTVEVHRAKLMAKLAAESLAEVVQMDWIASQRDPSWSGRAHRAPHRR